MRFSSKRLESCYVEIDELRKSILKIRKEIKSISKELGIFKQKSIVHRCNGNDKKAKNNIITTDHNVITMSNKYVNKEISLDVLIDAYMKLLNTLKENKNIYIQNLREYKFMYKILYYNTAILWINNNSLYVPYEYENSMSKTIEWCKDNGCSLVSIVRKRVRCE